MAACRRLFEAIIVRTHASSRHTLLSITAIFAKLSPMQSATTISYAAGIVDGEGCISAYRRQRTRKDGRRYFSICVSVAICNTKILLLNWRKENFGFSIARDLKRIKANHKPRHAAYLQACKAKQFLELVYPYLVCKKRQATLAMSIKKHLDMPKKVRY